MSAPGSRRPRVASASSARRRSLWRRFFCADQEDNVEGRTSRDAGKGSCAQRDVPVKPRRPGYRHTACKSAKPHSRAGRLRRARRADPNSARVATHRSNKGGRRTMRSSSLPPAETLICSRASRRPARCSPRRATRPRARELPRPMPAALPDTAVRSRARAGQRSRRRHRRAQDGEPPKTEARGSAARLGRCPGTRPAIGRRARARELRRLRLSTSMVAFKRLIE